MQSTSMLEVSLHVEISLGERALYYYSLETIKN